MINLVGDWWLTIARPDFADWATVTAYLITAFLAARSAGCAGDEALPTDRKFWLVATSLTLLLAVNELLDLQTLVTVFGRAHAQASGWYEGRRAVQYVFVAALGGAAVAAGAIFWSRMRTKHWSIRLALAGLLSIGLFVVARASSIHHFDDILGRGPAVFTFGSMQEFAGIAIVAVAARFYQAGHCRASDDISGRERSND